MRRYWIILAIAAQAGLLAVMAGQREWVVHTGRAIILRTAPLDPQDPMRGDYVRLQYDLSRVPKALCRDGLAQWFKTGTDSWRFQRGLRDRRVYAELKLDHDGLAELVALSDRRPATGVYLRGRVDWVDDREVRVRYGVEALFTQQGAARAFETKARGEMAGVPVDAEVALGSNGIAVLRGYHWEQLGLTVTLERPPAPPANTVGPAPRRPVTGLSVELKNHGTTPIAIVDRPGPRSFRLLSETRWGIGSCRWVHDGDAIPPAGPKDVVVLAPGASRRIAIAVASPDWFVLYQKDEKGPAEPVSLTKLDEASNIWFRIEYVPPSPPESLGLPHGELIQTRPLRSRAFSPAGAVFD